MLLKSYVTIDDYLHLLISTSKIITSKCFNQRPIIILAAAVSDYYIPNELQVFKN